MDFQTLIAEDVLFALVVLAYVLISGFTFWLPLKRLLKSDTLALSLTIPVSVSAQILLGYLFYLAGSPQLYIWAYLLIIVGLNYICWKHFRWPTFTKAQRWATIAVVALGIALLTRFFYDAFSYAAPGNPDTMFHIRYLREIKELGFLQNSYYAPGFHLYLEPLSKLIPIFSIGRFAGPAIGILTILAFMLALPKSTKGKITLAIVASLFFLPIFGRFHLQLIGFFPSALSFLFLVGIIPYFWGKKPEINPWRHYLPLILVALGLSFAVPYVFVAFGAAALIIMVIAWLTPKLKERYLRPSQIIVLVCVLGMVMAFLHVYLSTRILAAGRGFPNITTVAIQQVDSATGDTGEIVSLDSTYNQRFCNNPEASDFVVKICQYDIVSSFIAPMVRTGADIIGVKKILPPNSLLTVGAYGFVAIGLAALVWAIRIGSMFLATISLLTMFYGASTITGIFELSHYRGRNGWYFSMFTTILLAGLWSELSKEKWQRFGMLAAFAFIAWGLITPLIFPRTDYPEIYQATYRISRIEKGQFELVSRPTRPGLVSTNITYLPLELETLDLKKETDRRYLILEKKVFPRISVLEDIVFSTKKEQTLANLAKEKAKEARLKRLNDAVKASPKFAKYELVWENENIEVYVLN